MSITKLNFNQISFIRIYKKELYKKFIWKEKSTLFGIVFREAGFYFFGELYNEEKLKREGFQINGKEVFNKPNIDFYMSNGSCRTKRFESDNDMEDFILWNQLKTREWIEV